MATMESGSEYKQFAAGPASANPPSYNESTGGEVHRRISIDSGSDDSSVNEEYDVASISSSIEDQLTWRGRMQVALHSHYFHYVIIVFVVLDAFIVLFELLLDVGAFGNILCEGENFFERAELCHFQRDLRDMCAPPALLVLEGTNISGASLANICTCGFRKGVRVCIPENADGGVNPALVLHYTSLVILSIFMLEIGLKMLAFRLKYFTHKFEVFDGIVVVISWVIDIASLVEEEAFEAASLLIILRLWRVIRIINGAVLSSKAQSDNELHHARIEARKIIHAFHKTQDKLETTEHENSRLSQRLKQAGISLPKSDKQPLIENEEGDSKLREE